MCMRTPTNDWVLFRHDRDVWNITWALEGDEGVDDEPTDLATVVEALGEDEALCAVEEHTSLVEALTEHLLSSAGLLAARSEDLSVATLSYDEVRTWAWFCHGFYPGVRAGIRSAIPGPLDSELWDTPEACITSGGDTFCDLCRVDPSTVSTGSLILDIEEAVEDLQELSAQLASVMAVPEYQAMFGAEATARAAKAVLEAVGVSAGATDLHYTVSDLFEEAAEEQSVFEEMGDTLAAANELGTFNALAGDALDPAQVGDLVGGIEQMLSFHARMRTRSGGPGTAGNN